MDLSEDAEEILEVLWTNAEKEVESRFTLKSIGIHRKNDLIRELTEHKLITLSENYVSLTSIGSSEAENVVRRHRLAERLLVDVLDIEDILVEEIACKFEHVIQKGVEDSICVLLGHPRVCPHGSLIPKGKCCLKGIDKTSRIVVALSQLEPDQKGRIAYINAKGRRRLQKLMAMGITPGMQLQVIQKFPSHVFQIGQTQIAVDEEIANEIFVLLTNSSG
jgi:DtxR family Mn-dependent transcriptional regulator